ncbi:MAG: hypothetical protein GY764_10005 [Halieaceae bacterium]|nr:hypothetical protein [Halieaceae bacterium]
MTLTKAALLEKASGRFEWVDVAGFGKVGIRSCPQIQLSRRQVSYWDAANNRVDQDEQAKANIHSLIDQVMISETEPMFGEDDFGVLAALDGEKLNGLYDAIAKFNGDQKKVSDEYSDTSKS